MKAKLEGRMGRMGLYYTEELAKVSVWQQNQIQVAGRDGENWDSLVYHIHGEWMYNHRHKNIRRFETLLHAMH